MKLTAIVFAAGVLGFALTTAVLASIPQTGPAATIVAKTGTDDGSGHNAGDDKGGKGGGADDGANHA